MIQASCTVLYCTSPRMRGSLIQTLDSRAEAQSAEALHMVICASKNDVKQYCTVQVRCCTVSMYASLVMRPASPAETAPRSLPSSCRSCTIIVYQSVRKKKKFRPVWMSYSTMPDRKCKNSQWHHAHIHAASFNGTSTYIARLASNTQRCTVLFGT